MQQKIEDLNISNRNLECILSYMVNITIICKCNFYKLMNVLVFRSVIHFDIEKNYMNILVIYTHKISLIVLMKHKMLYKINIMCLHNTYKSQFLHVKKTSNQYILIYQQNYFYLILKSLY